MTPKEKANEMYDAFFDTDIPDITRAHRLAKKYALAAVNEIINAFRYGIFDDYIRNNDKYEGHCNMTPYFLEVKTEIEKL